MREQKVLPREFEFYFPDLDNMILVQSSDDESVTIRCTKDNVTEKRKVFFIRQLATEGFIPDEYQWFSGSDFSRVQWIRDHSWITIPKIITRRSNRFMKLLLAATCLFWLAAMRVVIMSDSQHSKATTSAKPSGTLALSTRAEEPPEKSGESYLLPDNR